MGDSCNFKQNFSTFLHSLTLSIQHERNSYLSGSRQTNFAKTIFGVLHFFWKTIYIWYFSYRPVIANPDIGGPQLLLVPNHTSFDHPQLPNVGNTYGTDPTHERLVVPRSNWTFHLSIAGWPNVAGSKQCCKVWLYREGLHVEP